MEVKQTEGGTYVAVTYDGEEIELQSVTYEDAVCEADMLLWQGSNSGSENENSSVVEKRSPLVLVYLIKRILTRVYLCGSKFFSGTKSSLEFFSGKFSVELLWLDY